MKKVVAAILFLCMSCTLFAKIVMGTGTWGVDTYADHFGCKGTKSSPLTPEIAHKRLNFNYFKERLVHFNGTAVIINI